MSSFCSAKATHIFSAKNLRILYIESAKIVNKMTLNELVKLTMLWTTGPRYTATDSKMYSVKLEDKYDLVLWCPNGRALDKMGFFHSKSIDMFLISP